MEIRFLKPNEYIKTKPLAEESFGKSDDIDLYYKKDVFDNRIAVLEDKEEICSMVQLRRVIAEFREYSMSVWYILYVCTLKNKRRRGYMEKTMNFVLQTLKKEGEKFTFLLPVDEKIYRKFGFIHNWSFNENESDMLYAEENLTQCYACMIEDDSFAAPIKLKKADTISDFNYIDFDSEATYKYFDYFYIRPNKSFYSVPLDCYIYHEDYETRCALLDNRSFLMIDKNSDDDPEGCIPFCRENELVYYFKLQERYFNEVLKMPFRASMADSEGVKFLKDAGALDNYTITEEKEIFDYIYSGDDLRTLKGRKFAKKRNHINKFEQTYGGRWEYRTLKSTDAEEIISFLKEWDAKKIVEDIKVDYGRDFDSTETLEIELRGIESIIKNPDLMSKIKAGGIYIDGKLCAFSLGSYNPLEKMAVIDVEKALCEYDGLYQLINREFLLHEFKEAEIVNREDDVGLPGLRKSKMSYNPICFEKRFSIIQNDFGKKD